MLTDRPERITDEGRWVRVCRSVDVVSRRGWRVELDIEHDLALFRVNGTAVAVTNVCPHKREAQISNGHVENGTVTCPMHDWCFDLTTGQNRNKMANLATYRVEEQDGYVWALIPD